MQKEIGNITIVKFIDNEPPFIALHWDNELTEIWRVTVSWN